VALSVAIALAVTWLGLALAYFSVYPVGFYVTTLAFALYVLVRVARALAARTQTVAPKPAEAV
jgi:zinc/manganese transport system permease protein